MSQMIAKRYIPEDEDDFIYGPIADRATVKYDHLHSYKKIVVLDERRIIVEKFNNVKRIYVPMLPGIYVGWNEQRRAVIYGGVPQSFMYRKRNKVNDYYKELSDGTKKYETDVTGEFANTVEEDGFWSYAKKLTSRYPFYADFWTPSANVEGKAKRYELDVMRTKPPLGEKRWYATTKCNLHWKRLWWSNAMLGSGGRYIDRVTAKTACSVFGVTGDTGWNTLMTVDAHDHPDWPAYRDVDGLHLPKAPRQPDGPSMEDASGAQLEEKQLLFKDVGAATFANESNLCKRLAWDNLWTIKIPDGVFHEPKAETLGFFADTDTDIFVTPRVAEWIISAAYEENVIDPDTNTPETLIKLIVLQHYYSGNDLPMTHDYVDKHAIEATGTFGTPPNQFTSRRAWLHWRVNNSNMMVSTKYKYAKKLRYVTFFRGKDKIKSDVEISYKGFATHWCENVHQNFYFNRAGNKAVGIVTGYVPETDSMYGIGAFDAGASTIAELYGVAYSRGTPRLYEDITQPRIVELEFNTDGTVTTRVREDLRRVYEPHQSGAGLVAVDYDKDDVLCFVTNCFNNGQGTNIDVQEMRYYRETEAGLTYSLITRQAQRMGDNLPSYRSVYFGGDISLGTFMTFGSYRNGATDTLEYRFFAEGDTEKPRLFNYEITHTPDDGGYELWMTPHIEYASCAVSFDTARIFFTMWLGYASAVNWGNVIGVNYCWMTGVDEDTEDIRPAFINPERDQWIIQDGSVWGPPEKRTSYAPSAPVFLEPPPNKWVMHKVYGDPYP